MVSKTQTPGRHLRRRPLSALASLWAVALLALGMLALLPLGAQAADPVIAGAGDIACDPASSYFNGGAGTSSSCRERYTARLLTNLGASRFVAFGDTQYNEGTRSQFSGSYSKSWGVSEIKSRTAPAVGNHEYRTPNAADYFDYFNGAGASEGAAGPRDKGYYSYNVGENWHVVVLNSNCGYSIASANVPGGCGEGSPQETWLRQDLAASDQACTLAYWHHPQFGGSGPGSDQEAFWRALYEANADLVLNGHLHNYQRSALQNPYGIADSQGIRQIVVGTGGKSLAPSTSPPNTQVNHAGTYGVLKATLRPSSYSWQFVPEAGKTFTDSGSTDCHDKSSTTIAPPRGLTAANGDGKVALDWADNPRTGLAGYNVYRRTSSSSYSKLNDSLLTGSDEIPPPSEYTDSTAANGNRYYYVVKAVDTSGKESEASNEVVANPTSIPRYRDNIYATPGLVSYWRLGEASGNRAADEKGAYPGTYRGGVSLGERGAIAGDSDTAARFDGTSEEMAAGGSALALSTKGTIEGWFKWESGVALLRDATSGGGWILAYDSGGKLAYRVGGTSYVTARTTASVRNAWHHLAVTVSDRTASLYVDGALVHTGSGAGTTPALTPWHIMQNGTLTDQRSRGAADEVAIYSEALSGAAVQAHYRQGIDAPPAAPTGLSATPGNAKVELKWSDNSESDLAGYNVYRKTSSGSYTTPLNGGSPIPPSDSTKDFTEYIDSTASNGTAYTYVVKAVDSAGNESAASTEVSATPSATPSTPPASSSYRDKVFGTAGLVAYWRLGESSGTTAADERGAHPGTYVNGVTLGQAGALGSDPNTAARFDGSNDYVSVADHASLDTGDRFTLEAWVKRSSASTSTKTIFSKGSSSYRLSFANNRLTLSKPSSGTIATANVATTDTAGFHHVVATKSGATVKLYIDGVDQTGTVTDRTVANTSTALNIGRYTSGSYYFAGLIDEPAVYNSALSTAEVSAHYQAKAP